MSNGFEGWMRLVIRFQHIQPIFISLSGGEILDFAHSVPIGLIGGNEARSKDPIADWFHGAINQLGTSGTILFLCWCCLIDKRWNSGMYFGPCFPDRAHSSKTEIFLSIKDTRPKGRIEAKEGQDGVDHEGELVG